MFIDTSSLQVKKSGGSYINLGNYITEARYGYNKVWGDDSGRNFAGKMSGTLIGIFPKIVVRFRKLTKTELQTITPILDSASQTVKYYDPTKQAYVEMATYTGDYEITNNKIIDNSNKKSEGFEISFIAIGKRS